MTDICPHTRALARGDAYCAECGLTFGAGMGVPAYARTQRSRLPTAAETLDAPSSGESDSDGGATALSTPEAGNPGTTILERAKPWEAGDLPVEVQRKAAVWAHLGPVVALASALLCSGGLLALFAFVIPLYLRSTYDGRSDWVRENATESLNFQLTQLLVAATLAVGTVVAITIPVSAAFFYLGLAALAWVTAQFAILALAAASAQQGQPPRYPLTVRFVRR